MTDYENNTARDDGGSAFPKYFGGNSKLAPGQQAGMSLRDYFAATALSGLLVQIADWRSIGGEPLQAAGWAYELADAMLKERAK